MIYKHLYWSLEPCLNVLILLNLRLDTLLTNEDDDDDDDDYDDDKVYSAILLYTITVNYTGPCKQVDHNVVTWLVKTDSTNTCITWIACLFYSINVCKYYRFQYWSYLFTVAPSRGERRSRRADDDKHSPADSLRWVHLISSSQIFPKVFLQSASWSLFETSWDVVKLLDSITDSAVPRTDQWRVINSSILLLTQQCFEQTNDVLLTARFYYWLSSASNRPMTC